MSDSLRDTLPSLYGPLLPDFFDRTAILETRATCADCAMCDKGGASPALETAFFRPDIKCCSYHPTLPNYLVGALLEDASPGFEVGRGRIREKIARRIGVTPEWLAAPRKFLVLFEAARESSFGRSDSLLCPYYDRAGGNCSIWRYRESVCATFFCKHTAGAAGHAFWTALRRYLFHVERLLARHAAKSIDPALRDPDLPRMKLTREDLEDRPPAETTYAGTWGAWVGREEDFYRKCADRVRSLERADFECLVDEPGRALLAAAVESYDAVTQPKLLPRLKLNPDMRIVPAPGGVGVTTYSRYDSLFLTEALYEALGHFSGEDSVEVVLERLRRDHDVELPTSLLLELQLHGVVTSAEDRTPSRTPEQETWRPVRP
jgi:hypothetical protein